MVWDWKLAKGRYTMMNYSIGAITYRSENRYAQINYFKKLAEVADRYSVPFFVFAVDDIDLKSRRINGLWYIAQQQKWVRQWTQFPTVVYDHVRYHPTPQFKRYIKLRESGLMRFSYKGYANKLSVVQYLLTFPELVPYIPATEQLTQSGDTFDFIHQGPAIIKPVNGTGGRDVYRIEKQAEHYIVRGKGIPKGNMSKAELKKWIVQLTSKERFMIQRLIPIEYEGRTCDTRVLLQKNGEGQWSFTGMGTRIGRANAVASNLAKGASAIRTDQFIESYIKKSPQPIIEQIERIGLQIAECLERRFGSFVEFGLDIGIMPDGHFQLIEANSKPDRKIFIRTNQPKQLDQAIRKPLEYHLFLCKQLKEQKG